MAGFGATCFGCGCLNRIHRDEMIRRGVGRYNWQTGKWERGNCGKKGSKILNAPPLSAFLEEERNRASENN